MSVVDKLDAARHSITGSNLAKIACKATSREVMGPKRKHIDCKLLLILSYLSDFKPLFHYLFYKLISFFSFRLRPDSMY